MPIVIKPNASAHIRILAERHPDLTVEQLATKGGWSASQVKSALRRKDKNEPKSRAG